MKDTRALYRNSKKITIFGLLLAACFLFVFTGCSNPFRPDRQSGAGETGTLSLTIGGQNAVTAVTPSMARTIMPETTLNDFDGFNLYFFPLSGSNTSYSRDGWEGGFLVIELGVGSWRLYVTALQGYDEYDVPLSVATGNLEFEIFSGQNAVHNVPIRPIEHGSGTFSWDISFPDDVVTARMAIRRIYPGDIPSSHVDTFYFLGRGGEPFVDKYDFISLPAGRYRVIITLINNRDEQVALSEILHIYANLESHFNAAFEHYHFTVPLINLILNTWKWNPSHDRYRWHLIEEVFSAGYFHHLDINGVYSSNFADIVYWFNELSTSYPILPFDDVYGLKVLVDAALIGIASADTAFLLAHYGNRPGAEAAITGLVGNNTPISSFVWSYNTLTVSIGGFAIPITFSPGLPVPGATLADQFWYLRNFSVSGNTYFIGLSANETLTASDAELPTWVPNLTIRIGSAGGPHNITLSGEGPLFTVGSGVTLLLGYDVILHGVSNNNHLVRVNSGGTLIMNYGSQITGNINSTTSSAAGGGGVRVNSGGTFTMYGGTISGNHTTVSGAAGHGGGVRVDWNGTFNMHGGTITGNTAQDGGGVFNEGNFRMSNGTIAGNIARGSGVSLFNGGTALLGTFDGGVFSQTGTMRTTNFDIVVTDGVVQAPNLSGLAEQLSWLRDFAQSGGDYTIELSANDRVSSSESQLPTGRTNLTIRLETTGGMHNIGVYSDDSGSLFEIGSGVTLIVGDNVTLQGTYDSFHGWFSMSPIVRVNYGGNLIMNEGARITDNENTTETNVNGGGAVRVNSGGTFTMNGGEISGNSTTSTFSADISDTWGWRTVFIGSGGGVRVESGGTFNMRGGTISGNAAQNGGGVFVDIGGTFQISHGTIHGVNAATPLANSARGSGASLSNSGSSWFGTFSGDVFYPVGTLRTNDETIDVVHGALAIPERAGSLVEQLAWLQRWASAGEYLIELSASEYTAPVTLSLPTGMNALTIRLGSTEPVRRNINLSDAGSLFTINWGVTLVLDDHITLQGIDGNYNHLVRVNGNGTLIMNEGTRITGNENTGDSNNGAGVFVNSGGIFTMNGGEISGNSTAPIVGWLVDNGGGVHIASGGMFDMRGGRIFGNTALSGGGVHIASGGAFDISNGTIYGSDAAAEFANTAASGAALNNNGTARYGIIAGGVFIPVGNLVTTNNTIQR